MTAVVMPLLGTLLFWAIAAVLIAARPRSRAEERRRRRQNTRDRVPYKDRVGDTAWSAWFAALVCAACGAATLVMAIAVLIR
ncbi:hypothetical protein [Dactylosporangium salmoneum]|uniref:Secreted protein n=1 Tax=Dactylosporangium salmoneum TaxID=53361 RepID=A0ABP5SQC0_9ACTN